MSGLGTWGGKQAGAGRKSGEAWSNKRTAGVRKAAQKNRLEILADRDPLAELIRIGFESEDEQVRVKALSACLPHLYPRLSMSLVADATPEQAERITREMLATELNDRIAKLTIDHRPLAIETATDCQTEVKE